MFNEMDKSVKVFDVAILNTIEPTQKMIDVVADEWTRQYEDDLDVTINPEKCEGLTQLQIDAKQVRTSKPFSACIHVFLKK